MITTNPQHSALSSGRGAVSNASALVIVAIMLSLATANCRADDDTFAYTFPMGKGVPLVDSQFSDRLTKIGYRATPVTLSDPSSSPTKTTWLNFEGPIGRLEAKFVRQSIEVGPLSNAAKLNWWREFQQDELRDLDQHSGFAFVKVIPKMESRIDRLMELSSIVAVLLEVPGVTGFLNASARNYTSLRLAKEYRASDDAENHIGLFKLLMNLHAVPESGLFWVHTHGMEQFDLPDIELWAAIPEDAGPDTERVLNAAHYEIMSGRTLRLDEAFDLVTETKKYVVKPAKVSKDHYSKAGAIQLLLVSP